MRKPSTHFAVLAALLMAMVLMAGIVTYPVCASGTSTKNSDVPLIINVLQLAPDTLKITYDKPTDMKKATDPNNYWIQDLMHRKPLGIGTIGMSETPSSKNTLAGAFATITPADSNSQVFLIKFNDSVTAGTKYKLIVSFITAPNSPEYTGDNGKIDFIGK